MGVMAGEPKSPRSDPGGGGNVTDLGPVSMGLTFLPGPSTQLTAVPTRRPANDSQHHYIKTKKKKKKTWRQKFEDIPYSTYINLK